MHRTEQIDRMLYAYSLLGKAVQITYVSAKIMVCQAWFVPTGKRSLTKQREFNWQNLRHLQRVLSSVN